MRNFIKIVESAQEVPSEFKTFPEIIVSIREQFNARGISDFQIGNGLCDDFARAVRKVFEAQNGTADTQGQKLYIVATEGFFRYNEEDDPIDWDWKLLAKHWNIAPPAGVTKKSLKEICHQYPQHVWLTIGQKHYDAESPNGESSFFDLKFFKRWIYNKDF